MARTQTMVQLSDERIAALDREAQLRGVSRSALIREAVDALLAARLRDEVGERIAEGYRRVPQALPDEWGSIAADQDVANRELLQRLEREERDAGVPPW
jgi:predicted transcriptional regulator